MARRRASERSTFSRHEQLVDINTKRVRQPLEIVQGDISGLTFDMGHERPVQTRLKRERLLGPTF